MQRIELTPADFFVLCTPLLPFEELERWIAGLEDADRRLEPGGPPSRSGVDREHLRSRLSELVARPEILEALAVVSPSLVSDLDLWRRSPAAPEGRRIETSLVVHLMRMAASPSPEGLSAGFSTGEPGEETRIELAGRDAYRRCTRLDADDLDALAGALGRDPALRGTLRFFPNTSLHRSAGRLRYFEPRIERGLRLYSLVAVEPDEALETTLERARPGATPAELARALVETASEGDVSFAEAEAFVGDLIDAGLVVSRLSPAVTGAEPLDGLIAELRRHPTSAAVARRLEGIRSRLSEIDAAGLGADLEVHTDVARELGALTPKADAEPGTGLTSGPSSGPRVHVDLIKPARAVLGRAVIEEIERVLGHLDRLPRAPLKPLLRHFAQRFREHYGDGEERPLLEALDEGVGIGFGLGLDAAAMIGGGPRRQPLPSWLSDRLERALERGEPEISISDEELERTEPHEIAGGDLPLPAAFHVRLRLAAASAEALAGGRFRLHLQGLAGPSGARLVGRLCHADERLRSQVERYLRAEEAHDPAAVFAEVVHLPEGRPGNAVTRPRLRTHEIPLLGPGAAEGTDRIAVEDLRVRVEGPRITLRSARLGRRVVPRLTAAHFFGGSHQTVYRFLGVLQDEGVRGGWSWTWGPFEGEPFLPRVRSGRVVLSLATWRLGADEIERLAGRPEGDRQRQVHAWCAERRLPRWVVLEGGSSEMPVDLHNPLCVDAFLATAATLAAELATLGEAPFLTELFPDPGELCVGGPEGRFVSELIVPVLRSRGP